MFAHPIPADLWAELRAEGLIAPHVPTPGTATLSKVRGAAASEAAGVAAS